MFEVAGLGWNPGVAVTSCAALGLTSPVALFPHCNEGACEVLLNLYVQSEHTPCIQGIYTPYTGYHYLSYI